MSSYSFSNNIMSRFRHNIIQFSRRGMSDVKPGEVKVAESAPYASPNSKLSDVHRVSNLERYFLVWTKKFKSVDQVPGYISRDMMEKTRNIVRIRLNLSIIALTLVGAFLAARSGKKAQERGETLTKYNSEWHKQYNEAQNPKEAIKTEG